MSTEQRATRVHFNPLLIAQNSFLILSISVRSTFLALETAGAARLKDPAEALVRPGFEVKTTLLVVLRG